MLHLRPHHRLPSGEMVVKRVIQGQVFFRGSTTATLTLLDRKTFVKRTIFMYNIYLYNIMYGI